MKTSAHYFIRSRPHLSLAIALGVAASLFLPHNWSYLTRALTAWNIGVWFYLITMAWMMMRADHRTVKRMAAQQDEKGAVILACLVVAIIMSAGAITTELVAMHDLPASTRSLHYVFVMMTLVGSWFLLGVLFCIHYAHLYYQADKKPLAFPGSEQPDYWDFLYFSFTIAVAAQTSDVSVPERDLRKLVLGQSVLSFFFNLLILGLFVNIAASLLNT